MSKPYREYTPEDIYNMRLETTTLRKQLDQLKEELEVEKNWHKTADEISKANSEYTTKLKQAIEKIKEIAKFYKKEGRYTTGVVMDKILKICDEVENDNA